MTITLRVLYDDLSVKMAEIKVNNNSELGDDVALPKDGVLAIAFSTKVEGVDTRVQYEEGFDNYMVIIDNTQNLSALYVWDDNNGGWNRIANPRAGDGYAKAMIFPALIPYRSNTYDYWIFRGKMVSAQAWLDSETERDNLR